MEELERCPFCDSPGIVEEVRTVRWSRGKRLCDRVIKYIAQCTNYRCVGRHGKMYVDRQNAIDKWNTRNGKAPAKPEEPPAYEALRAMISDAIAASRQ